MRTVKVRLRNPRFAETSLEEMLYKKPEPKEE
jgi:hypothetical protein